MSGRCYNCGIETFVTTYRDVLTDQPVGAVVKTDNGVRVKTDPSDEWDMVMTSEEILNECRDGVAFVLRFL